MDGLYDSDIVAWAYQQADHLRRLREDARLNDRLLDWDHVIEEVEAVGHAERQAVESLLLVALIHIAKLSAWPGVQTSEHWAAEVLTVLAQVRRRYRPSMRQYVEPEVASIWADARRVVLGLTHDGTSPGLFAETCPFVLSDLLSPEVEVSALVRQVRES